MVFTEALMPEQVGQKRLQTQLRSSPVVEKYGGSLISQAKMSLQLMEAF